MSPLVVLVALAMALAAPVLCAPVASAEGCPDVQVVYARGTFEPPGVGATGQAFVDRVTVSNPPKRPTVISGAATEIPVELLELESRCRTC